MNALIHDPRHASVYRVIEADNIHSAYALDLTVGCNNTSCPDSTFKLGTVLVQAAGRVFWAIDATGRNRSFRSPLAAFRWLRQGCP